MKQRCRKVYVVCIRVLICFLIACSGSSSVVLCFGADGHVELESTFHEHYNGPVHFESSHQGRLSHQIDHHEKDECCRPCVDIPVSLGLKEALYKSCRSNPVFLVQASVAVAAVNSGGCSQYFVFGPDITAGFYTPLRSIILLI